MGKTIEIKKGDKYGRLTIFQEIKPRIYPSGKNHRRFTCICDCGNQKDISLNNLRKGHTTSCGCYRKEIVTKVHTIHGLYQTSEYNSWDSMKQRCLNPNFKRYKDWGGRGIKVCDRWLNSFENFIEDMGLKPTPQHSIDRIDNNGNYELSNCRWATKTEQVQNRRKK